MSSSKTAKPPVQASYRASAHRGHSTPRRLAAYDYRAPMVSFFEEYHGGLTASISPRYRIRQDCEVLPYSARRVGELGIPEHLAPKPRLQRGDAPHGLRRGPPLRDERHHAGLR
mmetsp:Transcript_20440/g.81774  ORF Transcript_20440/g.81774 Transcript_20440/m.81774 type:complete len:114 (-) Transcript_20440:431-772(-)